MNVETALRDLRLAPPPDLERRVLIATGVVHQYVVRDSPIGEIYVAFGPDGVTSVDVASDDRAFTERYAAATGRVVVSAADLPRDIGAHLDEAIRRGRPGRLMVDLSALSDFQRAVLHETAAIPSGEVRPYAWVAQRIGMPTAARAVGTALARNPVPVIIPCHRVVRSDGRFGRYSLGADENKPRLLAAEGLDVASYERLAARGVRFIGSDTTRIFCHPTCRAARRITDAHRVEFTSESEARAARFRPCKVCRPAAA